MSAEADVFSFDEAIPALFELEDEVLFDADVFDEVPAAAWLFAVVAVVPAEAAVVPVSADELLSVVVPVEVFADVPEVFVFVGLPGDLADELLVDELELPGSELPPPTSFR